MRKEDWVIGSVLKILDGDTLVLEVEQEGINNDFPYNPREIIRLGGSAPNPETKPGKEEKEDLSVYIAGQQVKCFVKARDEKGRLCCDVHLHNL